MLEMLGGGPPPSAGRHETLGASYLEAAVAEAWGVHDEVTGMRPPRQPTREASVRELAARSVRSWARDCRDDPAFERILPALLVVAESANPHLHPRAAAGLWRTVADSPCAKALPEGQRRWVDLFRAVAQRDPEGMAARGVAILNDARGIRAPATEYAFLATATALACRGDAASVRALLASAHALWVRDGERATELRLLDAVTNPATAPAGPRPACGAAPHS
jgi:hypothetical protein